MLLCPDFLCMWQVPRMYCYVINFWKRNSIYHMPIQARKVLQLARLAPGQWGCAQQQSVMWMAWTKGRSRRRPSALARRPMRRGRRPRRAKPATSSRLLPAALAQVLSPLLAVIFTDAIPQACLSVPVVRTLAVAGPLAVTQAG